MLNSKVIPLSCFAALSISCPARRDLCGVYSERREWAQHDKTHLAVCNIAPVTEAHYV
jgi:hypothetical protein